MIGARRLTKAVKRFPSISAFAVVYGIIILQYCFAYITRGDSCKVLSDLPLTHEGGMWLVLPALIINVLYSTNYCKIDIACRFSIPKY